MDDERIRFLYGDDILDELDDWDLADEDDRAALLEDAHADLPPIHRTLQAVVANHILDDDPPEVWTTVQRLRAEGLERDAILDHLVLALEPTVFDALRIDLGTTHIADRLDDALGRLDPASMARYLDALAHLPLPPATEVEDTVVEVVLEQPGVASDDLVAAVVERLGRTADDASVNLVERTVDALIRSGAIDMIAGDRLVAPDFVSSRTILTHRLDDAEIEQGAIDASFDLSPFGEADHLHLGDDLVHVRSRARGTRTWCGPEGWLSGFTPGTVVAVSVDEHGTVTLDALDLAPPVDPDLVRRLRAAYDLAVDEPWLPVSSTELVQMLLADDAGSFGAPQAPLQELAAAAGLEVRRDEAAHEESVWFSARTMSRRFRIGNLLPDDAEHLRAAAWRVLDALDLAEGADPSRLGTPRALDDDLLREVLADLRHEEVLLGVLDAVFADTDDGPPDALPALADALLAAGGRNRDKALAHLFAALVAERQGRPLDAEQHLLRSQRLDEGSAFVADRLAWYASDRGDAATAVRLWRQLEADHTVSQDLATVEPFAAAGGPTIGRNEPCWCGSGRKYKQCHLGQSERAPLPDRVGWLCRKAVGYLERRGFDANRDAIEIASLVASDPFDSESLIDAFDHPIVLDLALTELGWFRRFLDERGELLPDDERLLAESWTLVERTVYEVVEVRPGEGLQLRDLRTGEVVDVRERTFSRDARQLQLICARAVPDGHTHQFVGGVIPVRPGQEQALLDLLDHGDAYDLASWVRAGEQPPTLANREGEPFRECGISIRVPDEGEARAFLDASYVAGGDEDEWEEVFALDELEQVQRARLALDGTLLSVETNSDARADRVIAAVLDALPGAEVVRDERKDLDLRLSGLLARATTDGFDVAPGDWDDSDLRGDVWDEDDDDEFDDESSIDLDDPAMRASIEQLRDRFEERWCDEPIPALGGRTPRECAEDPTRREEVVRLIASFEGIETGGNVGNLMTMRPERLRELLGL